MGTCTYILGFFLLLKEECAGHEACNFRPQMMI